MTPGYKEGLWFTCYKQHRNLCGSVPHPLTAVATGITSESQAAIATDRTVRCCLVESENELVNIVSIPRYGSLITLSFPIQRQWIRSQNCSRDRMYVFYPTALPRN